MKLPAPLSFEWDKGNIEKNWERHGVHFREAEEVFLGKSLKIFPDPKHSQKEERFVAFGESSQKRNLTVFFTIRNERVRVISARDQSRKERLEYAKK